MGPDVDGLDRYVLRVDQRVPVDSEGFLDVPPEDAWWLGPDEHPRPAADLAAGPSFVLLAPGGVGKTRVLQNLRARESDAREIDLRWLKPRKMDEALTSVMSSEVPAYLDGIDEVALGEQAVYRVLQQRLTSPEALRVRWRLACRHAAWNPGLAAALRDALPGFEELRLLPLTRSAVGPVVAGVVAEPEEFLDALVGSNLGRLAATPSRLRAVARQWELTGNLPANHVEAIRFEIRHLLAEHDPLREAPTVSMDRRERVAKRLGAFAILSGVTRFSTAETAEPSIVSVTDLPSAPEPDEVGIPMDSLVYRQALGTALFDTAPGGAVSFRHQQYAEYLAAAYLVDRGITHAQLLRLLAVQDEGTLPGPVVELTTWLTALQPGLTGELIGANALVLLQAGVEIPSPEVLAAIVDGLLSQAAVGELDPAWSLDMSWLAHPDLEQQLQARFDHGFEGSHEVWWVAALAAAGACRRLTHALVRTALDPQWYPWARRACIQAVHELGSEQDLLDLKPLLHLDDDEDPDDEVLAATIEALYPSGLLTTRELLGALRPRRNPNLLGAYLMLLGQLSQQIPDNDLPAVLDWAVDRVADGEEAYDRLLPQLVERGWHKGRTDSAVASLVHLLAALAQDSSWYRWSRREGPPWTGGRVGDRRQLAVAVAEQIDDDSGWLALLDLGLVTTGDLAWLVEELPDMPEPARGPLAECLAQLVYEPTAEIADLLLTLPEDHPAHETTQHLRRSLDVHSEVAQRWRTRRAREAEAQAVEVTADEHRQQLLAVLQEAEADTAAWWRVTYWLAQDDPPSTGEALFSHDLTRRPGWRLLDEDEHQRALESGLQYLNTHELQSSAWRGQPRITSGPALRDWAGVYLLTTLARHYPDQVREFDPEMWARWAPAIIGAWNFDRDRDAGLRGDLIDLAPPQAHEALHEALLEDIDARNEADNEGLLPSAYERLTADLAPTLSERLLTGRYSGTLAIRLLEYLVEHAPESAVQTCRRLRDHATPELASRARKGLAALDPAGTAAELTAREPTADELVEIMPHLPIEALDEAALSSLARLLLNRFPYEADPPTPTNGFGSPESETRQMRQRILDRLTELAQLSSLQQLQDGQRQPDRDILARYIRRARARAADLAFRPLTPQALLQLLGRSDARLVRHSGDLLDVVTEHLTSIQHDLVHRHTSRFLWNVSPDGSARPKTEDEISDWIRHQLDVRLGVRRSVVDREIEVARRAPSGIGTRIDLTATTPTATQPVDVARVIIEAKLISNRGLLKALRAQLVEQYLVPTGWAHAIYLIYWVPHDQRPPDWSRSLPKEPEELLQQLAEQADGFAPELTIKPVLLDISRPSW